MSLVLFQQQAQQTELHPLKNKNSYFVIRNFIKHGIAESYIHHALRGIQQKHESVQLPPQIYAPSISPTLPCHLFPWNGGRSKVIPLHF